MSRNISNNSKFLTSESKDTYKQASFKQKQSYSPVKQQQVPHNEETFKDTIENIQSKLIRKSLGMINTDIRYGSTQSPSKIEPKLENHSALKQSCPQLSDYE